MMITSVMKRIACNIIVHMVELSLSSETCNELLDILEFVDSEFSTYV